MSRTILTIKNAQSRIESWTGAVYLGDVGLSIVVGGSESRTELKALGETFRGKGASAVLALQDLTTSITKAAIKQQRKGRAPDRVRVAATLLQGGPN